MSRLQTHTFVQAVRPALLATLLACFGSGDLRLGGQETVPPDPPVRLPMEPDVVVLQLEHLGGLRPSLPEGFEPTPRLRVYADGRILTGQDRPGRPVFEWRLDEEQLHRLMAEIVGPRKFLDIDARGIEEAIERSTRPVQTADGTTSRITVRLASDRHEVALYALRQQAADHPEIGTLQNLLAVERLCEQLCGLAQLGGPERLEPFLRLAQSELDARFAGQRVRGADLESVSAMPDGGTLVRFLVRPEIPAGGEQAAQESSKPGPAIAVEVHLDATGNPVSTWSVAVD